MMHLAVLAALLAVGGIGHGQTKYPQIDLAKQKKGTPTYAAAGFLTGWRKHDIKAMRPYVQLSILEDGPSANRTLQSYLDTPLMGARIISTTPVKGIEDMLADVKAQLWIKGPKGTQSQLWKFRIVRESKPRRPDPKGKWGVNPVGSDRTDRPG